MSAELRLASRGASIRAGDAQRVVRPPVQRPLDRRTTGTRRNAQPIPYTVVWIRILRQADCQSWPVVVVPGATATVLAEANDLPLLGRARPGPGYHGAEARDTRAVRDHRHDPTAVKHRWQQVRFNQLSDSCNTTLKT